MAESAGQSFQSQMNCQFCTEKAIKYKCSDCKRLLCADCNTKIHKLESAKGHKIVSINSLDQEIDFASIKCHKHDGNYCCLFCKVCDVSVCPSCIAKEHARHEMLEINDSYNAKIELLKSKRGRYEKEKDSYGPALSNLKDLKLKVSEQFGSIDDAITEHETILNQKLKKYIEYLRDELVKKKKTNDIYIESEMTKILTFTNHIDKGIIQVENVVGLKDAAKFFEDATSIINLQDVSQPIVNAVNVTVPKFTSSDFSMSNVGRLEESVTDMKLEIVNQFQTNMSLVGFVSPCSDGSLWIGYNKDEKIHRVQTNDDNFKVLTSVDSEVYGMTLSSDNNLLVCADGTILKQINKDTGSVYDTLYNIDPFDSVSVHVTNDMKIVIGGYDSEKERSVVVVMNAEGERESVYEKNNTDVPLFRYPLAITSTSNNCIHVVDYKLSDEKGRVVVLSHEVQVNIYTGHPAVNKDKQFRPARIVTTPADNVIVADVDTNILHVFDNFGNFLRYFNTRDRGIKRPLSLAYTSTGQLYIGCSRPAGSQRKEAKLYLVNISGC